MIEKAGLPGMVKHFEAMRMTFPKLEKIADFGRSHAVSAVTELADSGKFKEAVDAAKSYEPLLGKPEQVADLAGLAYQLWAKGLGEKKQWEAALERCAEGLKAIGPHERVVKAIHITVDEWAEKPIEDKKWDEALRIYDRGLKLLPKDKHLENNREVCEEMKKKN